MKKLISLLLSAMLLLGMSVPVTAEAAGGKTVADMEKKTYTDPSISSLPLQYRLYVPDDYDPGREYPLLLYLNGAGARGSDNTKQLSNLAPLLNPLMTEKGGSEYPCIIAVPQCRDGAQWVDTPWGNGSYQQDDVPESKHMKLVMGMINSLQEQYSVDASRIYLMGQSMGGYGTWDAITRHPDTFAAAVPMCGAGDPSKAERIKDVPLLVLAGSGDDTVPVSGSRDMVNALKTSGSHVTYLEFPNEDHYIQRRVFEQPERLYAWLFAQSKDGGSSRVNAPYPAYTTQRWYNFDSPASLQDWTISGDAAVSGSTLSVAGSGTVLAVTGDGTFGDGMVTAFIKQTGTSGGGGLVVRQKDSRNLINVRFTNLSGTGVQLLEYSNGSASSSPTVPFSWNTDTLYLMKIVLKGDTLDVYIDNVCVFKNYKIQTEALKSTGRAGLRSYNCPLSVDDFRVFSQDGVNISTPVMQETLRALPVTVNGRSTHIGKTIKILVDGEETAGTTVSADGSFTAQLASLPGGAHTITAQAVDGGSVLDSAEVAVTSEIGGVYLSDIAFREGNAVVGLYNSSGSAGDAVLKVEAFDVNGKSLHSVQSTVEIAASGTKQEFSIAFDNVWLKKAASVRASLTDAGGRPLAEDKVIDLLAADLSLDDFDDYQVLQRNVAGKNRAVTVTGRYNEENVTGVQVSVVRYDSGQTVLGWKDAALSNGKFTAECTVPQGGWYRLQVRALNAAGFPTAPVAGNHKWGVGMVILCIGQSNMVGIGLDRPYVEADDLVASYRNDGWEHLSDPYDRGDSSVASDGSFGGSMVPAMGNQLAAAYGIPVAFIPCAKGGTSLLGESGKDWSTRNEADPFDRKTLYGNSLFRARAVDGIELIVMNQGEHDVSIRSSQADFEAGFRALFDHYQEDLGYHVPLFYGQVGASGHSAFVGKDEVMTGIRTAQDRCDNGVDFLMATTEFDLAKNGDDLHYTTESQSILGERMANAIRYYYKDSAYYRGPELQSASFAGSSQKVIDVTVRHSGGSDLLVPQNASGFTIVDENQVIVPASVEKRDGSTLRLTVSRPLSKDAKLRYLYGSNPDTKGIIHDNTPLSLPMMATTAPLAIVPVSKTELSDLYQQGKDRVQTDYTPSSWTIFQRAMENAETVLADDNADKNQIDRAREELEAAVSGLVRRADITDLEVLYNANKGRTEISYTPSTWKPFSDALKKAGQLLQDLEVTRQQVDDAKEKLQAAVSGLVRRADITNLQVLYNANKDRTENSYTPSTWRPFADALKQAGQLLRDPEATRQQVDDAGRALQTAVLGLKRVPVELTDNATGVCVSAEGGVLSDGVTLSVKPVAGGESLALVKHALSDVGGRFTAWDISLMKGGEQIQLNGTIAVTVPVPQGYNAGRLVLYHVAGNGIGTKLPFVLSGGSVRFTASHLSVYVLAEREESASSEPSPESSSSSGNLPSSGAPSGNSSSGGTPSGSSSAAPNSSGNNTSPQTGASAFPAVGILVLAVVSLEAAVLLKRRK